MELWRIRNGAPDLDYTTPDFSDMRCEFWNLHLIENKRFIYLYEHTPPPQYIRDFFHIRGLHLEFRNRAIFTRVESIPQAMVFSTCRAPGFPNGANTPGHDFDYITYAFQNLLDFDLDDNTHVYVHPVSSKDCSEIQSKFWKTLAHRVESSRDLFNVEERIRFDRFVFASKKKTELPWVTPSIHVMREYIDRTLRIMQVPAPGRCIRGVREKSYRHRFLNQGRLMHYLRRDPLCEVREIGNMENLSAREEIALIHSLETYVTPAGGGSFSAMFLRAGARLVVGKICWPVRRRGGGLKDICPPEVAVDLGCLRSDNLLWNNLPWLKVGFVGPRRVSDLFMEAPWVADKDWASTQNAFGFSYNVSLHSVNLQMKLVRTRNRYFINVGGFIDTGSSKVTRDLVQEIQESTQIQADGVPESEAFYLLKSLPRLDFFHTCDPPRSYLPSVGKFACKIQAPCREEVRQNFLFDTMPYIDFRRKYVVINTPTISLVEMEACFQPKHYITLRHPWFWSQQFYLREYQEEHRNMTQEFYAIFKTIQTIRMFLEVVPVPLNRLTFVRFEQESPVRSRSLDSLMIYPSEQMKKWIACTRDPECNRCLIIAQEALGIFGYNLVNPWEPINPKSPSKLPAYQFAGVATTLESIEKKLLQQC
jgi:hypothetical protein